MQPGELDGIMTSMPVHRIPLPQAQELLAERIKVGNELLRQATAREVEFDLLMKLWSEFNHWRNNNRMWLGNYLGHQVRQEYEEVQKTWKHDDGGFTKIGLMSNILPWEISTLESIRERLPALLSDQEGKASGRRTSRNAPIFIVHGSDTLRAESVAHTVASATGRETIILRDLPNSGRTLIEKFEEHASEVSYAIIVLTADDKGGRADETGTRARGRQNVIFEMGYFYGLIGRDRVSVLIRPGVEKPSDVEGIAYITFDDDRAWKTELLRELKHAKFDIHL
jgi:predicted nucleotide-binding protein